MPKHCKNNTGGIGPPPKRERITKMETYVNEKKIALKTYLKFDVDPLTWAPNRFQPSDTEHEYLVLTDDEANTAVRDDIVESLWTFRPSFLMRFVTGADAFTKQQETAFVKSLEAISGKLCETANPVILAMIGENLGELIEKAVESDGRGHFLAGYDEKEIKLQGGFFAYQTD
jgi:hypothetical protein